MLLMLLMLPVIQISHPQGWEVVASVDAANGMRLRLVAVDCRCEAGFSSVATPSGHGI